MAHETLTFRPSKENKTLLAQLVNYTLNELKNEIINRMKLD